MTTILVIAYGNPLRCDDGLAWQAAKQLSQADLPANVEILRCHQLTPDLASAVSQASTVLFIDASREGSPGELVARPVHPATHSSAFTHDVSPGAMLRIAQELFGASPAGFAISIGAECFGHGDTLSPKVAATVPRLVALVAEMIRRPIRIA